MPKRGDKKKILLVFTLILISVVSFFSLKKLAESCTIKRITDALPEKKFNILSDNIDFIWSKLDYGMAKDQVYKLLGKPHNNPQENVWIWLGEYEKYKKKQQPMDWFSMIQNGEGGYFIVFANGHLVSKMYSSAAASPWNLIDAEKVAKEFNIKQESLEKELHFEQINK